MKRVLSLAALGLLAAALAWSSGQSDTGSAAAASGPVTIRVRTGWNESAFPNWAARIAEYEKTHPGVTVNVEWTSGGTEAIQQLRTDFMVGNAPEVIQAWKTDFNEYVAEGLLRQLNDLFKEAGWLKEHFYEPSLAWGAPITEARTSKEYYGIPDYVFPSVWYYNTGDFQKLGLTEPTNLDELLATLEKLKSGGKRPMIVVGQGGNGMDMLAKAQVQTAGLQPLLDANAGKAKLTAPSLMEAAGIFEQLIKYVDQASVSLTSADSQSFFGSGEASILPAHTGFGVGIDKAAQVSGVKYDVFKRVDLVRKPKNPYSVTFGGLWATPKANKLWRETYDFMKYIFSVEVMKETAEQTGRLTNFPGANEGINDPLLQKIITNMLPYASVESFYLIDVIPSKVKFELASGIQGMIQGTVNADQLMTMAQAALEDSRK